MCVVTNLLCPRCERQLQGVTIEHQCLLKLQGDLNCRRWTADRHMTPMEAVRTGKSCDQMYCPMNVAQQLITQSQTWHAVELMDMEQIEGHQAQPPENSRTRRARIINTDERDEPAEIPSVATLRRTQPPAVPDAPEANTEANKLLLLALNNRRKLKNGILYLVNGRSPAPRSFWEGQIRKALASVKGIYQATSEDYIGMNLPLDNSKRAALEEEYAELCCPGDVSTIQEFSSSQAGHAHQSGFQQASGSETTSAPASGRKRKASSQFPVSSTSESAGSQLDSGSASFPPLRPRPTQVNPFPAASNSMVLPPPSTSAALNNYGSASQPGHHVGDLSQSNSAPAGIDRDSVVGNWSGLESIPASDLYGQPTLPGQVPLPEQSLGRSLSQYEVIPQPSSSAIPNFQNQESVHHSSPPNYVQSHFQPGQVHTTQDGFQGHAPASDQPSSAEGVSIRGQSGFGVPPVPPMDGPPPEPRIPAQDHYGSGAFEGLDDFLTQSPDNANGSSSNNF